jgi:hypothetical protein
MLIPHLPSSLSQFDCNSRYPFMRMSRVSAAVKFLQSRGLEAVISAQF